MDACLRYAVELGETVARLMEDNGCDCILLSGGVDTGFLAVSSHLYARGFERAYTVVDGGGRDYGLASSLASALGLRNHIIVLNRGVVLPALDLALSTLRVADPVEIAGATSIALGLIHAKSDGCKCVVTGDGGDELFLGYGFLLDKPLKELSAWRERMAEGHAFFNSKPLASTLGVRLCTPLYHESVRNASLRVPPECLVGEAPRGGRAGKLVVRLFLEYAGFPEHAWQGKRPVTSGSGILGFLESLARSAGIVEGWEPSRLHAFLLARMRVLSIEYPGPCKDESRRCPVCGRCLEGNRCPFCGAYISEGGVSVYKGAREEEN
ncbi:MAG: asparagine synthase-related protein [Desulfurococcales archaeon]|nr:asparagine synthase-related protein [Desulfurococcales archaeon]